MSSRRRAREIALQVLYQLDLNPGDPDEALELYEDQLGIPKDTYAFVRLLVKGVSRKRNLIDRIIEGASYNWRLNRMAVVDRNIIRIGVFEILFCDDIPPKVSINEAVELAKKFGSQDSKAFVNGVLDRIYNLHNPNEEIAIRG